MAFINFTGLIKILGIHKKELVGILGIILLVLGFLSIPASQVEAFTPIGDYMRIQLDVGGNSMRKFYSTGAGTTEVFNVVAATGDYWVGGVQYQCGLLITEEEPLAFDNHWIWWVRDGTILKWGIDGTNSLATNIAGKSINCCNNGDPQCAMDFLVLCTFFGANVLVNEPYSIGWVDNCAGTDCDRASADTVYQHSNDRLCLGQWLECGSAEVSCNGNYACNLGIWTDCAAIGQTCDIATGTCVASVCGNNVREGTEVCDGTDLAGETCITLGFTGPAIGGLACNATCTSFDTSGCTGGETNCSDGIDNDTDGAVDCQDSNCLSQPCAGGGVCIAAGTCCGNGTCDTGETNANCSADCGSLPVGPGVTTCVPGSAWPVCFLNPAKSNSIEDLTNSIVNWILGIAASLIILFLIIGGVMYITAAGNEERLNTAKRIVIYAIFGLVLILISYSLVGEINRIIFG